MAAIAKVHRSMRIEADIDAAILAALEQGETITEGYNRFLKAGVDAIAGKEPPKPRDELLDALNAHIATLSGQLTVKDSQIEALNASLQAAQALQAANMPIGIEPAQDAHEADNAPIVEEQPRTRGGLFAAIFGR